MATEFTDQKDASNPSIVFIFAVDIISEWLQDDSDCEFETENWDTNSTTITFQKNEISYTLLRTTVQQIYPFVLEDEFDEAFEVNIYDTVSHQKIINDNTLIKVINVTPKNKEIHLTIEIADLPALPIVCDNGSYSIKIGFSGDDVSTAVFPNVIGTTRQSGVMIGMVHRDFVGDEAKSKRAILSPLKCPMDENRQISSWNDMERVWNHSFYNECRIQPEEHRILLTDSPLNSKSNRKKMVQCMFESFNTPACYVEYQPILALIASHRKTGIVLDSGWKMTECTPIYNGKIIKEAVNVSYFGGRDITKYLSQILNDSEGNHSFSTDADMEIVRDIKETLCYAKSKLGTELNMPNDFYNCSKEYAYDFGDIDSWQTVNSVVRLSNAQRYMPVECLFNPLLMGKDNCDGFHELIYKSIVKCDVNIQSELLNNIVLCGGNTMFPFMTERLTYELENIKHNNEIVVNGYVRRYNNKKLLYSDIMYLLYKYSITNLKVIAPERRKYTSSVWIGGSILTNRAIFNNKWITKAEYDEFGPDIVDKKCI
eukprot:467364_1